MKSIVPLDIDAAFVPWRTPPGSMWLYADIGELRELAEYQSFKAMAMARMCLDSKEVPDASAADCS